MKSTYRVEIDTLQHDGELRARGSEIELTPAQAAQLLAIGAISESETPKKAKG